MSLWQASGRAAEPVHARLRRGPHEGMDVAWGVCGLHAGLDAGQACEFQPALFRLKLTGSNTWHLECTPVAGRR